MTIQSGTHAIESMQLEERRYAPLPEFARNANAKPDIYTKPLEDFWKEEASKRVSWFKPFDTVLEWKLPYAKWFLGGQLNVCYNCVDRHVESAPKVKKSVVLRRTPSDTPMKDGRDVWWQDLVKGASTDPASCPCQEMDAEDLLYLLYTSGTTAKPKGIVHTTAGYLVGTATTHHYIFDIKPNSVYWCAADIGWVTGHSYIVYGPLCNGTTGVIYEGVPDFHDKDRWWSIIERYKVDILYTAPTAIRTHMKWGPEYAKKHDLSSLRLLGSVGEPINPEAWIWYRENIGRGKTPVVDTWWQTETGMIL